MSMIEVKCLLVLLRLSVIHRIVPACTSCTVPNLNLVHQTEFSSKRYDCHSQSRDKLDMSILTVYTVHRCSISSKFPSVSLDSECPNKYISTKINQYVGTYLIC